MIDLDRHIGQRAALVIYAGVIVGCLGAAAALAQESPDRGDSSDTASSSSQSNPSSGGSDVDDCDWQSLASYIRDCPRKEDDQ